jgi:membrane-bound serine protease (ClpP class)
MPSAFFCSALPANTKLNRESGFQSRTLAHTISRMEPITLYITLLLAGFMLIGMEIFVPGGILGIIGALAWLVAAGIGLSQFDSPWNMLSAFALLFMGALTFVVWIKYFPKSRIGKSLSLDASTKDYKAHTDVNDFPASTIGEAVSTLRPSGIARFDGKRLDVVADGEWIEAGQPVKISSTTGGHISVVKA